MKLTDVRLSHSKLYEAVEYAAGDGRPRRSANFIVEKGSPTDKLIEAEIAAKVADAFPKPEAAKKWLAGIRGQKTQDCYRAYKDDDGFMNLASHRSAKDGPVGVYDNVIDPQTKKVRVLGENEGRPYDGCYVNATVDIYLQTKGENQGIRCSLIAVQFARDGDAFSGTKAPSPDDFEAMETPAGDDPLA